MSDYASTSSRPASPVGDLPQVLNAARPYRFTWDVAQKKPGPGSISETTEGRDDYFAGQASYDVLAGSTANLPLGSFLPEWSSSVHGFHAISTVVNSPHKKSAPPKAHSALPAVPPADLPRVKRKDFDLYLKSVGPEWERFEKNALEGREGVAQVSIPNERPSLSGEMPVTPRTPRPPPGKPLPPLEIVPEVYFENHFNLGDPRTFNIITEFSDQHEGFMLDDPASFTYAQPLIDKMSGYADTIEQHLVREISVRSTSFFAALSNLQDLQTESEQCLGRITRMRALLKEVDEKGALKGLEVIKVEARMRNLQKLRVAVGAVGNVVEMIGVARGLVEAGQWGEALDVVDELNALWNNDDHHEENSIKPLPTPSLLNGDGRRSPLPTVAESPIASPSPQIAEPSPQTRSHKRPAPSIPISDLRAFSALPSNLHSLILRITSSLTSEIVSVLKLDLIERIDRDPAVLNGLSGPHGRGDGSTGGMHMSLKDKLRPLLHSLVRTDGIREATTSWREVVLTEVIVILKRHIPLFSLDSEEGSQNAEATKQITSMEHSAFLDLCRIMYDRFLRCIEGLQAQNAIIIEVLENIHQPKALDVSALREELGDILSSAGELANARAAKVISLRIEQHTALDLRDFYTFFNVSWDFVVKTEVICRRMIVGLRGVVVSQSKTFIQAFHQSRLSQSAKLVEDEHWNPAEVSPVVQNIVNLLVEASVQDPPDFNFNSQPISTSASSLSLSLSPTPLSPIPPPPNGTAIQPSSPVPSPMFPHHEPKHLQPPRSPDSSRRRSSGHGPSKHLKIEDRNFFAVSATLEVLVLLADYLRVIVNLPTLVTETMSRVIELLKAFNSRTCQVVLGAGAMRSAGLKNITAKHLALASQSLSIMISLIPYVREAFRRHLSQKQAVMLIEFDKLKRDYQEHQNEIHAKLIAIMGDRLSAHIKSLQVVNWDVPRPGGAVNEYMEMLTKETVTLHKVLSRYLSVSVVEFVMTQVFAAINHRLSEEYAAIDLPSLEAKERLLADARFLHEKLSGLKNVRSPTAMLEIVVQEKRVGPQTKEPLSPNPPPQRAETLASPPPSTTSRFAHMFSRATPSRSSTLLSPRPTTPVPPADTDKALPAVSTSPDPSTMLSDIAPSPTPPVMTPSRPQSPAVNGHAQPVRVPGQESNTEEASLQDVAGASDGGGLVEEPGLINENEDASPPLPPAKSEKSSEEESPLPPSKTEPALNGDSPELHGEKEEITGS
ncbi:Vps54-like protein-domain-containing protein [Irpex rosettiformis]|uniref:Vps54-like protein-domain-containing protein n=1 Tax=Irpex rosettiformis TaxID=378272 RepID=A0ACB8TWM3_9APHY|nr:Vps54-like protein-domain-containing protein [Irpex rosettiformis]